MSISEELEAELDDARQEIRVLELEIGELDEKLYEAEQIEQKHIKFMDWLAEVYPNALTEYNAIEDIKRSV